MPHFYFLFLLSNAFLEKSPFFANSISVVMPDTLYCFYVTIKYLDLHPVSILLLFIVCIITMDNYINNKSNFCYRSRLSVFLSNVYVAYTILKKHDMTFLSKISTICNHLIDNITFLSNIVNLCRYIIKNKKN